MNFCWNLIKYKNKWKSEVLFKWKKSFFDWKKSFFIRIIESMACCIMYSCSIFLPVFSTCSVIYSSLLETVNIVISVCFIAFFLYN